MKNGNGTLLAGDVGGTKTALAVYTAIDDLRQPIIQKVFFNREYRSLEEIVNQFLTVNQIEVAYASIAVAGPIVNQTARITNLTWVIDADELSQVLGQTPVRILNDLEAIASAMPFLQPQDWHSLNEGKPIEHGALAVIAPGTGLGEAFLIWDGTRYLACPSEGGHTDFAPTTPLESELLDYLQKQMIHVSYERLISGMGLPNIYAFLKNIKQMNEPDWLGESLRMTIDATPIIVQAAIEQQVEICEATLKLFTSILASEAGNLALKVLSSGGVYVSGGIPPRILPYLTSPTFIQRFIGKGRLTDFLRDVPIRLVMHPHSGLMGAACYGFEYRKNIHE